MLAVIYNFILTTIVLCKMFTKFFSLATILKNIRDLWTQEGRKKYSYGLRLWVTLIMLLHFCALAIALGVVLGLSILAAPIVTAIVNITSLIKNLANLIFYSYHEVTCQRKINLLEQQLADLNLNFIQNLSLFEEIEQNIKRTSSIETKIKEFKGILEEIDKIQEPLLFNQFVEKMKKQIYEAIELDDLIVLYLQNIGNNKTKINDLIKNLNDEIKQLKQNSAQKQESLSMLKILPSKIADFKSEMDSLQQEVSFSNLYRIKLQSIVAHFKNIQLDIDYLEKIKSSTQSTPMGSYEQYLHGQIPVLENKIKNALKPVMRTKANRFFMKIVNSFKDKPSPGDFITEKKNLIRLLKEELAFLTQDLVAINLTMYDKWQQNLVFTNSNNVQLKNEYSKIYVITRNIIDLKKQKEIARIQRDKEVRSVFLGVLLTANAILLCLTLHWILAGVLTLTMLALTVLSVLTDIMWFLRKKDAEQKGNAKEQTELRQLRQHKLAQIEKMDLPTLEETLKQRLAAAFDHLDTTPLNETNEYQCSIEYFTLPYWQRESPENPSLLTTGESCEPENANSSEPDGEISDGKSNDYKISGSPGTLRAGLG